jgi:uncharacterized membrane protein YeaQ/YmgE (transglycosylase-associated protein family)
MGLIITLILAGLVGWLASIIMKVDYEMGPVENVVAGLVGGLLGNLIFGWLAPATPTNNGLSVMGIVVGVIGACIAIGIWRAVRR